MAVSKLSQVDLQRFHDIDGKQGYTSVPNEWLLGRDRKTCMAGKEFRDEIRRAIKCVKAVIPKVAIEECLLQFDSDYLQQQIDEVTSAGSSLTTGTVKLLLKQQAIELTKFVRNHELNVDNEVQKKDGALIT